MLRVSKLADYATVIMVYLTHQTQLCNAKMIASATHVALPTVSKILKQLTQADLLISERGSCGGYRLKKTAHRIPLVSILAALDARQGLTVCSTDGTHCELESVCRVKNNWQLLSHFIEKSLASITLAQLAAPSSIMVHHLAGVSHE